MSDAFIGEVRAFPYTYYPQGWMECNGQTLLIGQYTVLYAVIGFTYGGDGKSTFALPNLQGFAPVGVGQMSGGAINYQLGKSTGQATVTLTQPQLPEHNHTVTIRDGKNAAPYGNDGFLSNPTGADLGLPLSRTSSTTNYTIGTGYGPTANALLAPQSLASIGGAQPHENRQPFLAFRFCICVEDGEFPPKPS